MNIIIKDNVIYRLKHVTRQLSDRKFEIIILKSVVGYLIEHSLKCMKPYFVR